ncbi:hypothetical protein SAMN05421820_113151 [Pedobacter steynii]|uniref:IPT/TIG domain-containing protein n=1 Tax=Pedobacter steynii TaxID=430522 RepID=A0A1H0IGY4_9SPHI|nr:hypothetical protein [Pedobacter steynii]NQX42899.1 hypothetical protein [Pedobacter steynii]SDO30672.1 hypothetical protein SAMN05421820_113151 [Pedobacter steynii]
MKKTVILSLSLFLLIGSLSVNANNDTGSKRKTTSKNLVKKSKVLLNMTGPRNVSLTGGPYEYTANVMFGNATELRWVVMGNPRLEFYASAPVNGKTSITLSGADFGATGQQFIYLVGETDFGPTIFANMGVNVTN